MVHKDHPMSTSEYICYLLVQRFTIKWVVRNSNLNMMLKKIPFPFSSSYFSCYLLLLAIFLPTFILCIMVDTQHITIDCMHRQLKYFYPFILHTYSYIHTLNVSFLFFCLCYLIVLQTSETRESSLPFKSWFSTKIFQVKAQKCILFCQAAAILKYFLKTQASSANLPAQRLNDIIIIYQRIKIELNSI